MTEHEVYIALNMIPGVGSVRISRWAEAVGSVAGIWEASEIALLKAKGVGRDAVHKLLDGRERVDVAKEMKRAEALGARILTPVSEAYPSALIQIYDPPPALYVRGDVSLFKRDGVAIVGTRRPTLYGQEAARRFGFDIANTGVVVVSGLALGIDTEAHRGALQAKGATIAVIGAALDKLAPAENRDLARSIVEGGGAVVSEFPFGRSADRSTFPMRNRVVSGMCKGVVIVEAGPRSGTLITAEQALEQGRSVMAVPGRIDSTASRGCHRLLKTGAGLVESLDDVLEEISQLPGTKTIPHELKKEAESVRAALTGEEQHIMEVLSNGEKGVDAIIRQTGLSAGVVGAVLVGLEMKRYVRMMPGRTVKAC